MKCALLNCTKDAGKNRAGIVKIYCCPEHRKKGVREILGTKK